MRANNNKVSEVQVREILYKAMHEEATYPELAEDYGLSARMVGAIVRREAWHHVDEPEGYRDWMRTRRKSPDYNPHPWLGTRSILQRSGKL